MSSTREIRMLDCSEEERKKAASLDIVRAAIFASVGLRVSGSHDLGEIACNLMLFAECYLWVMQYAHWEV